MKKMNLTLGLFFGLFLLLLSPDLKAQSNIAFFGDEAYTDMDPDCFNEGYGLSQSLIALGHTVNIFTGITDADFSAALAGQDILYFPEMEDGDLADDLSPDAITVIKDFVTAGGGLMVQGGTGFASSGTESDKLLNAIFSFALSQSGYAPGGSSTLNVAMAAGTPFEGGPATLDNKDGSHFLMATFPMGSKCIYENSPTEALVSLFPSGAGNIIHLGWDWFDGGPGCPDDDADWNDVLGRAVMAASAGAPIPTMGEWGLIILALLTLTLGAVTVRSRQMALAGTGNASVSMKSLPFERNLFGKMLALVMVSLAVVFTVAVLFFGYEMTSADVPGSLIAAPIAAYLLHMMMGEKKAD